MSFASSVWYGQKTYGREYQPLTPYLLRTLHLALLICAPDHSSKDMSQHLKILSIRSGILYIIMITIKSWRINKNLESGRSVTLDMCVYEYAHAHHTLIMSTNCPAPCHVTNARLRPIDHNLLIIACKRKFNHSVNQLLIERFFCLSVIGS